MRYLERIAHVHLQRLLVLLLICLLPGICLANQTVDERRLGVVTHRQSPKNWQIDVPKTAVRVEVALYYNSRPGTYAFGGWQASLKVNGRSAWRFLHYDNQKGGRISDDINGVKTWDKNSKGKWFDVTPLVKAGKNQITYAHNTGGSGIGVKIRILSKEPVKPQPTVKPKPNSDLPEDHTAIDGAYWGEMLAGSVWQVLESKDTRYIKLHPRGHILSAWGTLDTFYSEARVRWRLRDGRLILLWNIGSTTFLLPNNVTDRLKGTFSTANRKSPRTIMLIKPGKNWGKAIPIAQPAAEKPEQEKEEIDGSEKTVVSTAGWGEVLVDSIWQDLSYKDGPAYRKLHASGNIGLSYDTPDAFYTAKGARWQLEDGILLLIWKKGSTTFELPQKATNRLKGISKFYGEKTPITLKLIKPGKNWGQAKPVPPATKEADEAKKEDRRQAQDLERSYEIIERMGTIKSLRFRRELAETIPDEQMRKHQLAALDKEQRNHRQCLDQFKSLGVAPSGKAEAHLTNCTRELVKLMAKQASEKPPGTESRPLPVVAKTYPATRNTAGEIEPAGMPWESGGFLYLYSISIRPAKHTTDIICKWDRTESVLSEMEKVGDIQSGHVRISAHVSRKGEEIGETGADWQKGQAGPVVSTGRLAKLDRVWLRFSVTIGGTTWPETWKYVPVIKPDGKSEDG